MDNISHSAVGLAVGELMQRSLRAEPEPQWQDTRRRLLLFSCWAASNFPDLDLLLTPLLPPPLGYLLHHRGHTHTVLYAVPQALLLWLLVHAFWPRARTLLRASGTARRGFACAVGAGLLLHLAMDFLNSYGIHPFHPFDARWFYGDMVFIVEPLFWIACGVPVIVSMPGRRLKPLLLALLAGPLFFFAARGYLAWSALVPLLAVALVAGWLQRRAGERGRSALLLGLALAACFTGVQAFSSRQAGRAVAQALHDTAPRRLVDTALTAFPSNPFCWSFVSVESDEAAGSYTLRRGIVSIAPRILPPRACPRGLRPPGADTALAPGVAVAWEAQESLARLRGLQADDCHVAAWLRFARTPAVGADTAFDARFAGSADGNFTALPLAQFRRRECERFVPQWAFPRADLLAAPHGEKP